MKKILLLGAALTAAFSFGQAMAAAGPVCGVQTYGLAVTLKLRNAMQEAMVAGNVLPGGCVGSETEACMPNLTSNQISTIFANNRMQNKGWDDFRYDGIIPVIPPEEGKHSIYGKANLSITPLSSSIHIITRPVGIVSTDTFNAVFENHPCGSTTRSETILRDSTPSFRPEPLTSQSGKFNHSVLTDTNIEDCLETLNDGTNKPGTTCPLISMLGNPNAIPREVPPLDGTQFRWAIVILPANLNANLAKPYRYIKIDNISPASHNLVEGRYNFWAEVAPIDIPTNPPLPLCVPATFRPLAVTQTWGIVVPLGSAFDTANPPSFDRGGAFDPLRPVMNYSRATGVGAGLNVCRLPTIPNGNRSFPVFYPPYR